MGRPKKTETMTEISYKQLSTPIKVAVVAVWFYLVVLAIIFVLALFGLY